MADKVNFENFLGFVKTFDQKGLLGLTKDDVGGALEIFGVSTESRPLDQPLLYSGSKTKEEPNLAWKDGKEAHIASTMSLLLLRTLQNLEHYSNTGLLKNLESHHLDTVALLVSNAGNKRRLSGHNGLFLKILLASKLEHEHADSLFGLIHELYYAPFADDVDGELVNRGDVLLFSNNELNTLDSVLSKYIDAVLASSDPETTERLANLTKLLLEVVAVHNTNNDQKVIAKLLSFAHFCCKEGVDDWPKDTISKYVGLNVNNFWALVEDSLNTSPDEQQDWLNSEHPSEARGKFFGLVRLMNNQQHFESAKPELKTRLVKKVIKTLDNGSLVPTELLPALKLLSQHLKSFTVPSKTSTHTTSWPQKPDEALENELIEAIVNRIRTLSGEPGEGDNTKNKETLNLLTDILVLLSNTNIEMIERNFPIVFDLVRMDAELDKTDLEWLKTIWNSGNDFRGPVFGRFCFKLLSTLFDSYNRLRKLFVLFSMVNRVYKAKRADEQEAELHEQHDMEDGVFWIFMYLIRRRLVDGNENLLARLKHERFPQSLFTVVAFCVSRLNLRQEGQNRLITNDFATIFKNNNLCTRNGNPEEKTLLCLLSVLIAVRRLLANADLSLKFEDRPNRNERTDGLLEIVCTLHSWVVRVNATALKSFGENSAGGPIHVLKSITYHFKMINNEGFYYTPQNAASNTAHTHNRFCLSLRDLVGGNDDFKYDPIMPLLFDNFDLGNPHLRNNYLDINYIRNMDYKDAKALLFKRLNEYCSNKTNITPSKLEYDNFRVLIGKMNWTECPVITKTILKALDFNLPKFLGAEVTPTNLMLCQKSITLVALLFKVIIKEKRIQPYGSFNILIRWERNLFDVLCALYNWQANSDALSNRAVSFNHGYFLLCYSSLYFLIFTRHIYDRGLDPTLMYSLLHNFFKNCNDASYFPLYRYIKYLNNTDPRTYKSLLGPGFSKYVCGKWTAGEGKLPSDHFKVFILFNWLLISFPGSKPEREAVKILLALAERIFGGTKIVKYLVHREFAFKCAEGVFEAVLNFWEDPEDCDPDNFLLLLLSVPIVPVLSTDEWEAKLDKINTLAYDLQARTKAAFNSLQASANTTEQWARLHRLVLLNYLLLFKFYPFGILDGEIVENAVQFMLLFVRHDLTTPQWSNNHFHATCNESNDGLTILLKAVRLISHSKMPYFYYQFIVIMIHVFTQKTNESNYSTRLEILQLADAFTSTMTRVGDDVGVVLTMLVRTWRAIDKSGRRSADATEVPSSNTKEEVLKKRLKVYALNLIRTNKNVEDQLSPEVIRFYKENSM